MHCSRVGLEFKGSIPYLLGARGIVHTCTVRELGTGTNLTARKSTFDFREMSQGTPSVPMGRIRRSSCARVYTVQLLTSMRWVQQHGMRTSSRRLRPSNTSNCCASDALKCLNLSPTRYLQMLSFWRAPRTHSEQACVLGARLLAMAR